MTKKQITELDPEISAIAAVDKALKELPADAQARVLNYVAHKLKVDVGVGRVEDAFQQGRSEIEPVYTASHKQADDSGGEADELEGISPVAKKWMARNGLQAQALGTIFSLGVDEIDLVAKTIPGNGKKDRTRNIFLLKGVAAYIGTGVARFSHEQLKEACLHYQAYDANNFATYLKSFSGEVSGDKRTGYTLTPRGLAGATELVKGILQPAQSH